MPGKGFFTQSAYVLLDRSISIEQAAEMLSDFRIVKQGRPNGSGWIAGGDYLLIEMRAEVNGYVLVDVVDQPYPDSMGDVKTEPELLAAWSMSHFGPFVFPDNLKNAVRHCHSFGAADLVQKHCGFFRMRSSYILGVADGEVLVRPKDYRPAPELLLITDIAEALLRLPGALCYFNPNGETLHTAREMQLRRVHYARQKLLPVDIWANVRNFNLLPLEWELFDSVGLQQLDLDDIEACFHLGSFDRNEVGLFVRNVALYLSSNGPIVELGNTIDGPGGRWRALCAGEGKSSPPRKVLRLFPDGERPPAELLK